MIYFPHEGIFISASLYPTRAFFGLHIPEGNEVQLLENTLTLSLNKDSVTTEKKFTLEAIGQGEGAAFSPFGPLHYRADYDTDNYFGLLKGETKTIKPFFRAERPAHKWYSYRATLGTVEISTGVLTLPTLMINGRTVSSIQMPYHSDTYFDFFPLNC